MKESQKEEVTWWGRRRWGRRARGVGGIAWRRRPGSGSCLILFGFQIFRLLFLIGPDDALILNFDDIFFYWFDIVDEPEAFVIVFHHCFWLNDWMRDLPMRNRRSSMEFSEEMMFSIWEFWLTLFLLNLSMEVWMAW